NMSNDTAAASATDFDSFLANCLSLIAYSCRIAYCSLLPFQLIAASPHHATLHHEIDLLQSAYVFERIAWRGHDVGELPNFDRANLVGHSQQIGSSACG